MYRDHATRGAGEAYLSFPAFNFSGGIAASGEDFGVFAGSAACFEAPVGGFAVRRESVFCGGLLPPEELRSAMG
jgi:hypothetical protein